jgi:hypothetical protein
MVFHLFFPLVFAAVFALLATMLVWLTPVWLICAALGSLAQPGLLRAYLGVTHRSAASRVRFWFGLFYLPASFVTLVATFITFLAIFQNDEARHEDILKALIGPEMAIIVISGVMVPIASYFYDFYRDPAARRLFSARYFALLLWNLGLPYLFIGLFMISWAIAGSVPALQSLRGRPSHDAVFRVVTEQSACSRVLRDNGFQMSAQFVELDKIYGWYLKEQDRVRRRIDKPPIDAEPEYEQYVFAGMIGVLVDNYLRLVLLDAADPFDCHFSDIESNPDNFFVSSFLVVYRLVVAVLTIGVLAYPFGLALGLLRRRWDNGRD